jgi:hypothetical protein
VRTTDKKVRTEKEIRDEIKKLEKQLTPLFEPSSSLATLAARVATLSIISIKITQLKWVLREEDEQKKG